MTNLTDAANITALIGRYYEKVFTEQVFNATPLADLFKQIKHSEIPKGVGDTAYFTSLSQLDASTGTLTQCTVPSAGISVTGANVTAQLATYGDYGCFPRETMFANTSALNSNADVIKNVANQASRSVDTVLRTVLHGGGTLVLPNNIGAVGSLGTTDVFSMEMVSRGVTKLMLNGAVPFKSGKSGDRYVAVVDPRSLHDIRQDTAWVNASNYSDDRKQFTGEIGEWLGVRFINQTEFYSYPAGSLGGGTPMGVETFLFGKDSVAIAVEKGSKVPELIIKGLSAADSNTDDPLDQKVTIGWKARFRGVRLNGNYYIRFIATPSYTG